MPCEWPFSAWEPRLELRLRVVIAYNPVMSRKRPAPDVIRPNPRDSTLRIEEIAVDPDKHAEFKDAMLAAARAGVAEFPQLLETIRDQLRNGDPLGILASFASYGLQIHVAPDGAEKKALPDILQHHAELLQAILLTIPGNTWGAGMLTPQVMETVFDAVPKLSETFFFQRILDGQTVKDNPEALTVRSLQERVRLHTHVVRNWGYFGDVVRLSLDLYQPLDAALQAHSGFNATDVIEVLKAIISEFERRQSIRVDTLGKVLRASNVKQMARLYYRHVPDLVGSAEEMLNGLPGNITREQLMGILMAHYDLRLVETAMFKPADVAALTNRSEAVVTTLLRTLSFAPGALVETQPQFLFLANPVWDHPAIDLGDAFFIPTPQAAFSHIHRIMDRLAADAGLQEQLKNRRANFLENKLEAVFRKALPDAVIQSGVTWKKGSQQFENDLLVILDRVVIIAEAKSHRLTPEGLRGAPDRVKRHIRDMVLDPSLQSERLEGLILAARAGDAEAIAIVTGIGIDPTKADRIIRLSVTLDDLSILSAAEPDFKTVGWVAPDHALAPSILIADLICIADILDNPLLFLHYLSERAYLQKSFNLLADEIDFLGLYLSTGFNLAALRGKFTQFSPGGMSAPIDRYYTGRDNGINAPKPRMELRPLFRNIAERLTAVKPPGWTLIGFHLLSCADPAEQKAIERSLLKLRGIVRKNYRDPTHLNSLTIRPPEERKACVIFYLFPEALRSEFRQNMRQLAGEALETGIDACVMIARSTEAWGQPFETVLLVERT